MLILMKYLLSHHLEKHNEKVLVLALKLHRIPKILFSKSVS